MKQIAVALLTLLTVVLMACGSGSSNLTPKSINGFWTAGLQNPDGSFALVFNAVLAQGSGAALAISDFSIMSPPPCLASTTSQSGTFTVTGSSGGYQTGPFTMTVSTTFGTEVENVATLAGKRDSNGSISGNWSLTGLSGCNSSGNFLMTLPQ